MEQQKLSGSQDNAKKAAEDKKPTSGPLSFTVPRPSPVYYIVRWILGTVVNIFFREIEIVGRENVPSDGPVIFVGNHPNQFVDGMMMFSQSPRDIFMVIAESSLRKYALAGLFARLQKAIPVYRREDYIKPGTGSVKATQEGGNVIVTGKNTKFSSELKVGDQLHVKGTNLRLNVTEVISDEAVKVSGFQPEDSYSAEFADFKILPKIDQSSSYSAIYAVLNEGNCVGIFPEGGSSDQVYVRNLKVGVAYLALSARNRYPNMKLSIVPCGLNYIGGHRFRSKTLIEYGHPLTISHKLVERFANGDKKAVDILTEQISHRLRSVTLNIPEFISRILDINPFEAKDVIITARRLYQPANIKLPIQKYLELNRRFAEGFSHLKDEPEVHRIMRLIYEYNQRRHALGLTDRQTETAPDSFWSALMGVGTLVTRLFVILPCVFAIPGLLLHLPIGFLTRWQALRVAEAAAKSSNVKIEGRDVIASTKIALGSVILVIFYVVYGSAVGFLWGWKYAPVVGLGLPVYSYFCIKYLDRAAHLFRHTWPLVKYLISTNYRRQCTKLRQQRKSLQELIRHAVNDYGPRFQFWDNRLLQPELYEEADEEGPFSLGQSYVSEQERGSGVGFDIFDDLFDNDEQSTTN